MDRSTWHIIHVVIAWVVAIATAGYMLPWAIAATRDKTNSLAIALLNFFLGWTIIGWVVALIMACGSEGRRSVNVMVVQNNHNR